MQWDCTVGVGCTAAAANCCCGPNCGVCTGVPGPGPGQFGLATTLQICGSLMNGPQKICSDGWQPANGTVQQTVGIVGCGHAGGCVQTVAAVGQPIWVQPTMVQSTKLRHRFCVHSVAAV